LIPSTKLIILKKKFEFCLLKLLLKGKRRLIFELIKMEALKNSLKSKKDAKKKIKQLKAEPEDLHKRPNGFYQSRAMQDFLNLRDGNSSN
jgi:hypothetical protein